jgi:hypothetical protein
MALAPTQKFIEVAQIREGVIVLKNKALRGVLAVSSLNFALRSDEEQSAILYQFQNFLNSLDFSCQIICQSRKLNITGYLDKLRDIERAEENELLKIQIADYREFIKSYVEAESIMKKTFFIVVPFTIMEATGNEGKGGLLGKAKLPVLTEEMFQRCKAQLRERMEFLVLGLKRCGLQAVPLTTPELIELFWSHHHPKEAEFGYFPEIPPELVL